MCFEFLTSISVEFEQSFYFNQDEQFAFTRKQNKNKMRGMKKTTTLGYEVT
jgi:hypothetical protein